MAVVTAAALSWLQFNARSALLGCGVSLQNQASFDPATKNVTFACFDSNNLYAFSLGDNGSALDSLWTQPLKNASDLTVAKHLESCDAGVVSPTGQHFIFCLQVTWVEDIY